MNVDVEAVQAILGAKSHYEILSVEISADSSSIKKQYKLIALTVHPDKNNAEKADEAFKLLRTAFECLSDPIKRKDYDKSIAESNFHRKRPRGRETEEERKKRREEERERREQEVEVSREQAEAYCAAAAERMDKARNNWQQWQNKAWTKKK